MNPTLESLAMIWTKAHVSEAKTPEELCQIFWSAYYKIQAVYQSTSQNEKTNAEQTQSNT